MSEVKVSPDMPVSSSESAVLLLKIRESLSMDRRQFGKALAVSPGSVKAFELDPKCKPPLAIMERAVALLAPDASDEVKALCRPIQQRVESRNQMRLDFLNRAFNAFVEKPASQARSQLHDAIHLYYLNSQLGQTPKKNSTERGII